MPRIDIRYEPPSSGWLPLEVSFDGQRIAIDASYTPNNPIQQLLDAIRLVSDGSDATVWWHEEPRGFLFEFRCLPDNIALTIACADDERGRRHRNLISIEGSAREILLPFWRFLRNFQSGDYRMPHWPEIDYRDLERIGACLKKA